ncbi:MAG TPA: EAL domain-containing protein [Roseomonas sp.]|jgi:EAL domain-containing protein (putative c-di-GMP-specific phosphodiesterase class I)
MSKARQSCSACRESRLNFPFTMAFQPVVDLKEHRIDAHEALVRGPGGEGAGSVLAQVNETNLYAFDQACRVKAIEMASSLGLDGNLNINFLPNAVYEPKACIRLTLDAAARTGFPLDRLTFEFTENERVPDEGHILAIVQEYRRHGFRVALDDFATGYSGLSRLANLKPDIIKLDRALVKDCDTDRVRIAIVASMVALGAEVGIKVVAEGVERIGEVEALRAAGVRFMQGFYFARPIFQGIAGMADIRWPVEALPGLGLQA